MGGVFAAAHPSAGIHLGIVEVFALAQTGDMVDGSVIYILAATVSDLASSQDFGIGIVTLAETGSSVNGCPLIFALAYPGWIQIGIDVSAKADAVGA